MVKNTKGGSGHKKYARKNQGGGGGTNKTRLSQDPLEIYALCTKVYGGGMIGVLCQDGKERMCVMRKKFKGRGKRDNTVSGGVYLLVGKRDFECRSTTKKEKCDLLEVYNDHDKKILEQQVGNVNWNLFKSYGNHTGQTGTNNCDDGFEFGDEKTMHYETLLKEVADKAAAAEATANSKNENTIINDEDCSSESDTPAFAYMGGDDDEEEDINIDDI